MPQDGSNNYQYPPGTPGVPDQTIESEAYNTFLDDLVVNDLNIPRPVHRGGTGASTAFDARVNLDVERAAAQVTNYDAHVFESGSFWSSTTATAGPVASHSFTGHAVVYSDDQGNIAIKATDLDDEIVPGRTWVRDKREGVWSSWAIEGADEYVELDGDTMTGGLKISPPAGNAATLILNKPEDTLASFIGGTMADIARWSIRLGDETTEGGANSGSNFAIERYSDVGASLGYPLSISRATGDVTVSENLLGTSIYSVTAFNEGIYYFGNTSTIWLQYASGAFNFTGGPLLVANGGINTNGNITASGTGKIIASNSVSGYATVTVHTASYGYAYCMAIGSGGLLSFNLSDSAGEPGTSLMQLDATGNLLTIGQVASAWPTSAFRVHGFLTVGPNYYANGLQMNANYADYYVQAITIPGSHACIRIAATSNFEFRHDGSAYKPGGGSWADISDVRIKNVLGDYTSGLDAIAALRPVRYTFKGNDTHEEPDHYPSGRKPEDAPETKDVPTVPYPNSGHYQAAVDGQEFIGLIAQEAEIPMPEIVSSGPGYIDGAKVEDLRDIDTSAMIFALINAIRELKVRVEQLEAAG